MHVSERFNKKCKNLTSNKHVPFTSLANSLVRDGTSRYFRWRRRFRTTRVCKIPKTEVTGRGKPVPKLSYRIKNMIQVYLQCGCRLDHSALLSHFTALIGGKRFNAGEKLRPGVRCGSVLTMVRGGRSVYGLVKQFLRVVCACNCFVDFVVVTWFPFPDYPDGDPLTVRILLNGLNVNNITEIGVVPLYDIQPSRVGVEKDNEYDCMYMLRIDGTDTIPTVQNN